MDDVDPAESVAALDDLRRLNSYFGGYRVLRELFAHAGPPASPFTVLDVGAASGDMGELIRSLYPQATVFALDYRSHHLVRAARPKLVADAFHLPVRSVDYVTCSLFLHHFTDEQVVELLTGFRQVARRAVLVNDLERHVLPYRFVPLTTWFFRWHPIVQHDAPISVAAGFTASDLRRLASQAGFTQPQVWTYRPAFRVGLLARNQNTNP